MPKPRLSVVIALAAALAAVKFFWPAPQGAEFAREATVTRASGIALSAGDRCTVRVRNERRGRFACRVEVECAAIPLFGGRIPGGFALCTERDGRWIRAEDNELSSKDGDPALDLDLERETVTVRTERATIEARLGPALREQRTLAASVHRARRE